MFYFLLWVLTTTALFVIFRLYRKYQVDTLQAIAINYTVCVLTGSLMEWQIPVPPISPENIPWLTMSVVLGVIFIPTFYVTAITTQKVGVMVASLASRMSFFIPMLFSLFVFKIAGQEFNYLSYLGVFIAIIAIFLSIYKPSKEKKSDNPTSTTKSSGQWSKILLPLAVFAISGGMDTTLNYTNHYLLPPQYESLFSTLLFAVAGGVGMLLLLVKYIFWKEKVALKSIIAGIVLGVPNYFSIYLILKVLNQFDNNGAIVFPLFNVSVIGMATLVSVIFFREKMFWYNKLGLLLSGLAIFLIAHQAFI